MALARDALSGLPRRIAASMPARKHAGKLLTGRALRPFSLRFMLSPGRPVIRVLRKPH